MTENTGQFRMVVGAARASDITENVTFNADQYLRECISHLGGCVEYETDVEVEIDLGEFGSGHEVTKTVTVEVDLHELVKQDYCGAAPDHRDYLTVKDGYSPTGDGVHAMVTLTDVREAWCEAFNTKDPERFVAAVIQEVLASSLTKQAIAMQYDEGDHHLRDRLQTMREERDDYLKKLRDLQVEVLRRFPDGETRAALEASAINGSDESERNPATDSPDETSSTKGGAK